VHPRPPLARSAFLKTNLPHPAVARRRVENLGPAIGHVPKRRAFLCPSRPSLRGLDMPRTELQLGRIPQKCGFNSVESAVQEALARSMWLQRYDVGATDVGILYFELFLQPPCAAAPVDDLNAGSALLHIYMVAPPAQADIAFLANFLPYTITLLRVTADSDNRLAGPDDRFATREHPNLAVPKRAEIVFRRTSCSWMTGHTAFSDLQHTRGRTIQTLGDECDDYGRYNAKRKRM
jgi:hypothetical protein